MNVKLATACRDGYLVIVAMLLKLGADPTFKNNLPIRSASYHGHIDVVRLLLADKRVDPSCWLNWPIRAARNRGHTEVEKLLAADPRMKTSGWRKYKRKLDTVR